MNWFKTKNDEHQVEVVCPNCNQEQMVSENISAVFCKNCKKTIYTKKALKMKEDNPGNPISIKESPSQATDKKETDIPQKTPPTHTPPPPPPPKTPPPPPASTMNTGMKTIKCSNCHAIQEVPSIALASFCEKCGQRINLQDYKIKGHFHGELETRGEIRIATGAEVKANLNVGSAVIEGKIEGKIIAEHKVELVEGCLVTGQIDSPVLIVNEGAGFVGKAMINPPKS